MKVAHSVFNVIRGRRTASHAAPSSTLTRKISKNTIANVLCVVGLLVLVSSFMTQTM